MEILIQPTISYKQGYQYVWDKTTNFIVYQNNEGNIILGTIDHGGSINESEINKLYSISLQDFEIFYGYYGEANLKHIVYPKNFYNLLDDNTKENIRRIEFAVAHAIKHVITDNTSKYVSTEEVEEAIKQNKPIEFMSTTHVICTGDKPEPFFKIDKGYSIDIVENIMRQILSWFKEIGRVSLYIHSEGHYEREYTENVFLSDSIIEYFEENHFFIIAEKSEEDSTKIYDIAQIEKEEYNICIQKLDQYVKKLKDLDGKDPDVDINMLEASKNSIIYKRITGKYYPFQEKI